MLELATQAKQSGPNLWRSVSSVLVPGFLLVGEMFFIVGSNDVTSALRLLKEVESTSSLTGGAAVLMLLFALTLSYGVGTVSRALLFARFNRKNYDSVAQELEKLERAYGGPAVASAFRGHQSIQSIVAPRTLATVKSRSGNPPEGPAQEAETPDRVVDLFHYCKLWLRVNHPLLGIDHKELEVNVLFALIAPFMLGALLLVRYAIDLNWAQGVRFAPPGQSLPELGLAAVLVFLASGLLRQGRREQKHERSDALRNFALANWFESVGSPAGGARQGSGGDPEQVGP